MKTKFKHIISAALAFSLAAASASPAFAAVSPVKEEVVYVNLDSGGGVENIYVVNSFELPSGGTITDLGDYSEVKNLTTTEPMSLGAGSVTVNAPTGKFYYEGTLKSLYIPWDISVTYRLDGALIGGEELAGKSGLLEIEASLSQRGDANAVFRDHFAVQASLALDGNKCHDISAPGATVANAGDKKQMSYIILPGKDKTFTVTANVTDFEFDGISFNMIPLSLEIETPDTSEFKDQMLKFQDGAVELDDGVGELVDGVIELNDGVAELDDGVADLGDGVAELKDGVIEFKDGVTELNDGAADLKDGVAELYDGVRELRSGMGDFASGAAKFENGVAAFGAGLDGINTGAAGLAYGSQEFLGGLDGLITYIEGMLGAGQAYASSGVTATPGVTDAGDAEPLYALLMQLKGLRAAYSGFNDNMGLYAQGVSQLIAGYAEIKTGAAGLADGAEKFSKGTQELFVGVRDLYDGVIDFKDGTDKLNDGAAELADGVGELYDGTVELKDGTSELRDGTSELRDGVSELRDGTSELRDKTSDMDSEVDSRIDEMLSEYRSSDFTQVSFADAGNSNVRSVQFIMKTAGIKTLEAEAAEEEEPAEPTLWQRFLNLFPFLKK